MSKSELEVLEEEQRYWRSVAHAVGMRVVGWTYKASATFVDGDGTKHEVNGSMAEAILALCQERRP